MQPHIPWSYFHFLYMHCQKQAYATQSFTHLSLFVHDSDGEVKGLQPGYKTHLNLHRLMQAD